MALALSGRLNVTVATPSLTSNRIFSNSTRYLRLPQPAASYAPPRPFAGPSGV